MIDKTKLTAVVGSVQRLHETERTNFVQSLDLLD